MMNTKKKILLIQTMMKIIFTENVNTAIAVAGNPVEMAVAFKEAVIAGRRAYEAGLGIQADNLVASASSPLTSFLNE